MENNENFYWSRCEIFQEGQTSIFQCFQLHHVIYNLQSTPLINHLQSLLCQRRSVQCWIVQLTQLEMPGHIHCSEPAIVQVNIKTTSIPSIPSNTDLLAFTVVIIASLGQSLAGTFSYLGHLAQVLVTNPPVRINYWNVITF